MGAEPYSNKTVAADPSIAFRDLVDSARYEYGHGGYTGTIAEKDSYRIIGTLPPRITADKFLEILSRFEQYHYHGEWAEYKYKTETFLTIAGNEAKRQRFDRTVTHRTDPRPESLRSLITPTLVDQYSDKWGPSLMVELNAGETKRLKELAGAKGTRKKAFLFFGWASS